eukprot:9879899-Heterocapsa_arctica.AAC.1
MCLIKDLATHQLEKGAKHLQDTTITILDALANNIKAGLGDRYRPVNGRKTGVRIAAAQPSQEGTTPAPSRRQQKGA